MVLLIWVFHVQILVKAFPDYDIAANFTICQILLLEGLALSRVVFFLMIKLAWTALVALYNICITLSPDLLAQTVSFWPIVSVTSWII